MKKKIHSEQIANDKIAMDHEDYQWLDFVDLLNPTTSDYDSLKEVEKESSNNSYLKVKRARMINRKKVRMYKIASLAVLLAFGLAIAAANNPKVRDDIRHFFVSDLSVDDTNFKYAESIINQNETISSEVREYLLAFFKKVSSFYDSPKDEVMTRIADNIANYDFSKVDLSNKQKTVLMLSEIIKSKFDVSTKCLSREFYEYYFNTEPSKQSLLFDALSGEIEYSVIASTILNGGDDGYYAYLKEKYGFDDERIDKIRKFMVLMQSTKLEPPYNIDYYINYILSYYYENGGFLDMMWFHFNHLDIEKGTVTYNGNVFSDQAIISINTEKREYSLYYDRILKQNITKSVYFDKFMDVIKNFDGSFDYENPEDRMLFYLYSFILLEGNESVLADCECEEDYYYALYSNGTKSFTTEFYTFIENGSLFDITSVVDYLRIKTCFDKLNLTEEKLALWVELLICLQKEVNAGRLNPYLYENCFVGVSSMVSELLGEEALLDFQNMVSQGVNETNVEEIIKKYYWKQDNLFKKSYNIGVKRGIIV